MPYPRFASGRRWAECHICGFDWPLSELRKDSFGIRRCPRCWDQDGFEEFRSRIIYRLEEVKENSEEFGQ